MPPGFQLQEPSWREAFSSGWLPTRTFAATRVSLLLVWLACCLWTMLDDLLKQRFRFWWTKLTHWGAILELLYLAFAAFASCKAAGKGDDGHSGAKTCTLWFAQVALAMGVTVFVWQIEICLLYWLLDFRGEFRARAVIMHGGGLVLALVDLFLSRLPVRVGHIYMPMLAVSVYVLFSLTYYQAGGTNSTGDPYIYRALDWGKPARAGSLVAAVLFVATPAIHLAICGLVACRDYWTQQRAEAAARVVQSNQDGHAEVSCPSASC